MPAWTLLLQHRMDRKWQPQTSGHSSSCSLNRQPVRGRMGCNNRQSRQRRVLQGVTVSSGSAATKKVIAHDHDVLVVFRVFV